MQILEPANSRSEFFPAWQAGCERDSNHVDIELGADLLSAAKAWIASP